MARLTTGRLLAAACATIVLLVARVLLGRPLAWRPRPRVNWLGETPDAELRRRVAACESNLSEVWGVLNGGDADHR